MSRVALQPWYPPPPPPPAASSLTTPAARTDRHRSHLLIFVVPLVVYLAAGARLAFGAETLMSDAISRVANANYVLFSRDPHLAAVGFVWSPLPSLAEVPLLPLKFIWSDLVTSGFVACVQSAVFMAGAVYQLRRYFDELGLSRPLAVVATLLFAFNPLIAYYGMNGMSEASFLFFLIAGTRHLSQWLATERSSSLALSGSALGLAYLCRYEAAAAGIGATVFVALVTYWRARRGIDAIERRAATAANTLLIALPFLFAFVGWAAASWLIVGSPFDQFTSEYGNSAQTALSAGYIESLARPPGIPGLVRYIGEQWLALAPLGIVIAVVCAVLAVRRRDLRPTAPVVVLGSSLFFAIVAFLGGQTFGWLRFLIAIVPLVVILAAVAIADLAPHASAWRLRLPLGRRRAAVRIPRMVGVGALLAMVAVGLPSAASAMFSQRLGREEADFLTVVLRPDDATEEQRAPARRLQGDRDVARFLDTLALPDGAVLVDSADGFGVVLSSDSPRQFVITSDRDFSTILGDPQGEGVHYLLSRPRSFSATDAVAEAHPGIFDGTSSVARLERVFTGTGGDIGPWHLFRVLPPQ